MGANIISSISFQNFYNYYGNYDNNSYHFSKGLNIIVADNGAGKSKFFNGILWILKDQVFDSDEKRYYSVKDAYFNMISDKAKNETSIGEAIESKVKLLYVDSNYEYVVEKIIIAKRKKDGKPTDEKCWELEEIKESIAHRDLMLKRYHEVYDTEERKRIIEKIILPNFQPYALLQGEAIDQIIDFTNKDSLKKTIETLTNIRKIEELCCLSDYLKSKAEADLMTQRKLHTKSSQELENKEAELKKSLMDLGRAQKLLEGTEETLTKAQEERDGLLNNISNAQKRGEYREIIQVLNRQLDDIKEKDEMLLNKINSFFFNQENSWLVLGLKNEMETFSIKYEEFIRKNAEKKALNKIQTQENNFITILPDGSPDTVSLEKMLKKQICFVCGREALEGSEPWNHIKNVKDRPVFKTEDVPKSKNDFLKYFGNIQLNVQPYYIKIDYIREDILRIREQHSSYERQKKEIEQKKEEAENNLFQFGGTSINESEKQIDQKTISVFAGANQRIGQCETLIKKYKSEISTIKRQVDKIGEEIKKLGGSEIPKEYEDNFDYLSDINFIVYNAKDRIFDEMLKKLEEQSNLHFKNLTEGNNADGGILRFTKTPNGTIIIDVVDRHYNLITGLSEGFQRMKKLAVIMAIISSRSYNILFDYPLIADAPLSAFGKSFIEGFFSEVPKVFSQSIVLVKELYDKENRNKLSETGNKILKSMIDSNLDGTFYLNEVEENKPQIERETKIINYKN